MIELPIRDPCDLCEGMAGRDKKHRNLNIAKRRNRGGNNAGSTNSPPAKRQHLQADLLWVYQAVTGLPTRVADDNVTVLPSDCFELVIHALAGEPPGAVLRVREDAYVKPFFAVSSLAETRKKVESLGGRMRPPQEDWQARGFRACEAVDPDGNPIQLREDAA